MDLTQMLNYLDSWKAHVGGVDATWEMGDADYDGAVDGLDLALWKEHFNSLSSGEASLSACDFVGAPASFSGMAVPEPGTVAMLAAGMIGLLAYVRRKRKVGHGRS